MLGKKHSETAKLKISNKNKGNRHTLEAKQKIGEASKNRIVSEKTKEKHRNKVWTEKAIESRLSNCLKSAAKRKGTKNPKQSETIFINYVEKNKDLIRKIWDLYSQGNNRRQISLLLDISWDRVNLAINRKEEILKALEN